ncbi:ABC transporter ATP-binding protein [Bacillus sp. V5-8f]|uniref:ABC transporter ATP-binding protein n=1 Tax=Bacillus sp. V5-8f TaxID=2053044 RepID=UPI000C7866A3|nr:ABC transporter ATP-binding protein [Bacillus sp. V5-8f]PLT35145.1 molybdenum ABC transporter ATP-binding protein [Bacillus sp. V5-8f]
MSQSDSSSVISIRNVTWKQEGKAILNNISWEIKKGENWALLGLNGSGKTSILKMITGYQWPTTGDVSVLGNQFGKTNIPMLRRSIGWVSTSLDDKFHIRQFDTGLEVVLSGKFASVGLFEDITEKDLDKAYHLLEQFNIGHLANEVITTFSQGEKRKAMIARSLMAGPRVLILDEPCNGLDIKSKEQLLSTIEQMSAMPDGPTLLYVTHNVEEIIPSISHVILMHSGGIIAQGDKEHTLTEPLLQNTFDVPLSLDWENDRPWIRVKSEHMIFD